MGACITKPTEVQTFRERDISYRGGVPAHKTCHTRESTNLVMDHPYNWHD